MSRKMWYIFKKEFLQTIKSKAFILGTILFPILMLGIIGLPAMLAKKDHETIKKYYYIDKTNKIIVSISKDMPKSMKFLKWNKSKKDAIDALKNKKIEKFIYIPSDIYENYKFEYMATTLSDPQRISYIKNMITNAIRKKKMVELGIKDKTMKVLLRHAYAKTYEINNKGKKKKNAAATFMFAYILVLLIYMSVLSYAPMMMRSTIEDKNNRVVEIVISHVKPFDLMAGKIFGTAAVGLFQYLVWAIFAIVGFFSLKSILNINDLKQYIPNINFELIIYFLIFFILAYIIYAVVFAGIGALFSDIKDAQNFSTPFILLTIVPLLLFQYISKNPSIPFSEILSEIPYFSSLMLMRIGISDVPPTQIILSLLLQFITIIVEIWIVSKIYRIGILSYGKKPTFKDILTWLKK